MTLQLAGTTTHFVVLNMYQFVDRGNDEHGFPYRFRLDQVRGQRDFVRVLDEEWQGLIKKQGSPKFRTQTDEERIASPERVGFATGLFRTSMLQKYQSPLFRVDLAAILQSMPDFKRFSQSSQFKPIAEAFIKNPFWEVALRPTVLGTFVVHFVHRQPKGLPIDAIDHQLKNLQRVFDILSLLKADRAVRDGGVVDEQTEYDAALYRWLVQNMGAEGSSQQQHETRDNSRRNPGRYTHPMDLVTVRLQLATTIAREFLRCVTDRDRCVRVVTVPTARGEKETRFTVKFSVDEPMNAPVLESYTIHHIDTLTNGGIPICRSDLDRTDGSEIDIPRIRRQLTRLLEGSVLFDSTQPHDTQTDPLIKENVAQRLFASDQATWQDELCLMTAHATVLWPSNKYQDFRVTTMTHMEKPDGSPFRYKDYWIALERMIEFILEIRMLVQVLDRASGQVVEDFVVHLDHTRRGMVNNDIELTPAEMTRLSSRAANVSRLVSMGQSLSSPSNWCRVESAIHKANHLIDLLAIPDFLKDIEFDANTLINLVNHLDDLYAANLSEEGNRSSERLTLTLAAASLLTSILGLASFLADIIQVRQSASESVLLGLMGTGVGREAANLYELFGVIFAIMIFTFALGLLLYVFGSFLLRMPKKLWRVVQRLRFLLQEKRRQYAGVR
ncbi:MAG: hypothetical protein U0670_01120 [Anaerolineae bacterium]